MSTDLTISDKIDNLYSSFEKNESEIAELQSAFSKRSHAKDRLQHKKQAIASQLLQKEGEYQTLKVVMTIARCDL
jgi:chromosome segregation ATPase